MLLTLDTNILFQTLNSSSGASNWILQQVRKGNFQIALSVSVFKEYQAVLTKEKSLESFGMEISDVKKFLRFIAFVCTPFKIYYRLRPNLKDENDNLFVELAVTSQSEFLVTSNIKDFKNPDLKFDNLKIIEPSEFVKNWKIKNE